MDDARAEPTIGERIRELRQPAYTQVELAVGADVSVDVIRMVDVVVVRAQVVLDHQLAGLRT